MVSLPADLSLTLSFIHELTRSPAGEETAKALSISLESLSKLLSSLDCPLPVKEAVLRLLSEVLWTLCSLGLKDPAPYALRTELLAAARLELLKCYDKVTRSFITTSDGSSTAGGFPHPGCITMGGSGKFPTYFQALLEFVLAATKYQQKFHGNDATPSTQPATPTPSTPTITAAAEATPPSSEQGCKSSRRMRLRRSKRESEGGDREASPKEEWLASTSQAAELLRALSPRCRSRTSVSALLEDSLAGSLPSRANSRLVVVTGLAATDALSPTAAEKAFRKVCSTHGRLHLDELYMPVETVEPSNSEDSIPNEEDQEEEEKEKEREEETVKEKEEERDSDPPTAAPPFVPPHLSPPTQQLCGSAVLELCCDCKVSAVCSALLSSPALQPDEGSLQTHSVSDSLSCGDEVANKALEGYLKSKLIDGEDLTEKAKRTLSEVFKGVAAVKSCDVRPEFSLFLGGCSASEEQWDSLEEGEGLRTETKFLEWVGLQAKCNVRTIWLGLLAAGYDMHFDKYVTSEGGGGECWIEKLILFIII